MWINDANELLVIVFVSLHWAVSSKPCSRNIVVSKSVDLIDLVEIVILMNDAIIAVTQLTIMHRSKVCLFMFSSEPTVRSPGGG